MTKADKHCADSGKPLTLKRLPLANPLGTAAAAALVATSAPGVSESRVPWLRSHEKEEREALQLWCCLQSKEVCVSCGAPGAVVQKHLELTATLSRLSSCESFVSEASLYTSMASFASEPVLACVMFVESSSDIGKALAKLSC